MNVHIFSSENLYSFKYLKFLEGNFDLSSSRFVFKKPAGKEFEYSDKLKERIFYPRNNIQFFIRMLPELKKSIKDIVSSASRMDRHSFSGICFPDSFQKSPG